MSEDSGVACSRVWEGCVAGGGLLVLAVVLGSAMSAPLVVLGVIA